VIGNNHEEGVLKTSKKIAILQSNYIPWKGYFDLINFVDEFVIYDDVQYTRSDWRNRNIIKTPQDLKWLSIPISIKGKLGQKICEAKISDPKWSQTHWTVIENCYNKSAFFQDFSEFFKCLYLGPVSSETYLSEVNYVFITAINHLLGINTKLHWSSDFQLGVGKTERLIELCKAINATTYLSGPTAKKYLDVSMFEAEGIDVEWMDYSNYSEYQQLHGKFEHGVTILDLIFNEGPNAKKFMKSWSK
jgi:hypothetical protein